MDTNNRNININGVQVDITGCNIKLAGEGSGGGTPGGGDDLAQSLQNAQIASAISANSRLVYRDYIGDLIPNEDFDSRKNIKLYNTVDFNNINSLTSKPDDIIRKFKEYYITDLGTTWELKDNKLSIVNDAVYKFNFDDFKGYKNKHLGDHPNKYYKLEYDGVSLRATESDENPMSNFVYRFTDHLSFICDRESITYTGDYTNFNDLLATRYMNDVYTDMYFEGLDYEFLQIYKIDSGNMSNMKIHAHASHFQKIMLVNSPNDLIGTNQLSHDGSDFYWLYDSAGSRGPTYVAMLFWIGAGGIEDATMGIGTQRKTPLLYLNNGTALFEENRCDMRGYGAGGSNIFLPISILYKLPINLNTTSYMFNDNTYDKYDFTKYQKYGDHNPRATYSYAQGDIFLKDDDPYKEIYHNGKKIIPPYRSVSVNDIILPSTGNNYLIWYGTPGVTEEYVKRTFLTTIKLNDDNAVLKASGFEPYKTYKFTTYGGNIYEGVVNSTGHINIPDDGKWSKAQQGVLKIYDSLTIDNRDGTYNTVLFDHANDEIIKNINMTTGTVYTPMGFVRMSIPSDVRIGNFTIDNTPISYLNGNYKGGDVIYVPIIPKHKQMKFTINGFQTTINYADVSGNTGIRIVGHSTNTESGSNSRTYNGYGSGAGLTSSVTASNTVTANAYHFVSDGPYLNILFTSDITGKAVISNSITERYSFSCPPPPPPPPPPRRDPLTTFVEIRINGEPIQRGGSSQIKVGFNDDPTISSSTRYSPGIITSRSVYDSVTYTYPSNVIVKGLVTIPVRVNDFIEFTFHNKIHADTDLPTINRYVFCPSVGRAFTLIPIHTSESSSWSATSTINQASIQMQSTLVPIKQSSTPSENTITVVKKEVPYLQCGGTCTINMWNHMIGYPEKPDKFYMD